MEYLLFSILLAMALAMLFKIIGRLNIPLLVVVPMNYLTCTVTGFAFSAPQIPILELLQSAWLETALLQGLFFYASFSLLALASQRIGLAISALFSRIAMVVPVMVSFWLLGDEVTVNKLCGIAAAIIAMVLLLNNQKPSQHLSPKNRLILTLALFCLHGIQLSIMNLAQHYYLSSSQMSNAYMAISFLFAFMLSALVVCQRVYAGKLTLRLNYCLAGVVLGVCNYACVYFLISALGAPGWGGSRVFPIFSIGVVGGSALLDRIFFKESLSWLQWSGLGFGCFAVSLISV
jgi:drug/metabolite transporter (DMT)-like permease